MPMKVWAISIKEVFEPAQKFETVGELVSVLLPNVYILAGILFFILLIAGGLGIIIGAGGNDPQKVGQGQKAVVAALLGFLIIFSSYFIIQIIEVITGIKIFGSTL